MLVSNIYISAGKDKQKLEYDQKIAAFIICLATTHSNSPSTKSFLCRLHKRAMLGLCYLCVRSMLGVLGVTNAPTCFKIK